VGEAGTKDVADYVVGRGNDLAGTMLSDDITAHAGATDAGYLEPMVMERIVSDLGKIPERADNPA